MSLYFHQSNNLSTLKGIFILFFVLTLSNMAICQFTENEFQIVFGNQRKSIPKEGEDIIIGNDENGVYVMNVFGVNYHFYYYGDDLSVQKENSLELLFQSHKLTFEHVVQMKGKIYVIASYLNRKDNEKLLISYLLNKDLLTLSQPKLINVSSYKGFSSGQVPFYQFILSEDKNQLLCKINLPVKNMLYSKFSLVVFTNKMEVNWASSVFFSENKKEQFEMMDFQLGTNSSAYLLMKHIDNSQAYRRKDVNYEFYTWVFDSVDTSSHKEVNMAIIGQHVSEVKLALFQDGRFQVVGLFSDKYYNQKGVFKKDFDSNFQLISEFEHSFSTEFIIQYEPVKDKDKLRKQSKYGEEPSFNSIYIDNLIKNEDGSLTMLAERFQQYQTVNPDANTGATYTDHYESGSILIIKFSNQTGIEWLEQIPKEQYTINDNGFYSGYSASKISDDELIIVFNDDPKNNYYQSNERLYRWSGSRRKTDVILYQVGVEGRVKRSKLYNVADEEILFYPMGSYQFKSDEIILTGRSRRVYKYIKLVF